MITRAALSVVLHWTIELVARWVLANSLVSVTRCDVSEADILHYLLYDDETDVILAYLEDG
jgi:acyl-CoA synthetase (NDP forming)